jgi:hypothetical protein
LVLLASLSCCQQHTPRAGCAANVQRFLLLLRVVAITPPSRSEQQRETSTPPFQPPDVTTYHVPYCVTIVQTQLLYLVHSRSRLRTTVGYDTLLVHLHFQLPVTIMVAPVAPTTTYPANFQLPQPTQLLHGPSWPPFMDIVWNFVLDHSWRHHTCHRASPVHLIFLSIAPYFARDHSRQHRLSSNMQQHPCLVNGFHSSSYSTLASHSLLTYCAVRLAILVLIQADYTIVVLPTCSTDTAAPWPIGVFSQQQARRDCNRLAFKPTRQPGPDGPAVD